MRWSPDTCKCVFDFDPDPLDGSNQILKDVVNRCADHSGLDAEDLHQHVLKGENQVKNKVHSKLLSDPDLSQTVVNDFGDVHQKLKPNVNFNWSFEGKDKGRTLKVTLSGAGVVPSSKTVTQVWCDSNFGNGKVVIE